MTNLRNKYVIKSAFENDYYYFFLRDGKFYWKNNKNIDKSTFFPTKIIARITKNRILSKNKRKSLLIDLVDYDMLLKATVTKPLI